MTAPVWDDSGQGDLLALVATGNIATTTAEAEWSEYVEALLFLAALHNGIIRPNDLRPLVRGKVAPRRIGAFTSRALALGYVVYTGDWQVSDDTAGKNGGKPARILRWVE